MDEIEELRAALRRSEERLQAFADEAGDQALFVVDADAVVRTWGAGATRLLGHAPADVVGRPVSADGLPEALAHARACGRSERDATWTNKAGQPVRVVEVLRRLEGDAFTVSLRARFSADDVWFDTALDLLCIASRDGYFLRLNPSWSATLGWTPAELMSRPWIEFVHPDDRGATRRIEEHLARGSTVLAFTNRYACKDGSYRFIEWQAVPSGGVFYAVARDVSARRETQAALELAHRQARENEERAVRRALAKEHELREVLDNLPDLAWTAQPDGQIDYYNRRWFEYTGATPEELHGWGWQAVHDPELLPKVVDQWVQALLRGEAFEMEFPLRDADGTYRWFLTRVRPLRDPNGRIVRWFGSSTNIDDLRRLRLQLARSAEDARTALETMRLALRAANSGSFEWDVEKGRLAWSEELERIYDVREGSFDGTAETWRAMVVEADREQVDQDVRLAMQTERYTSREFRIRRQGDGIIRWLQAHTHVIRDAQGAVTRVAGVNIDITARKDMEEALHGSLNRYRATFDQASVGMAEVALDGTFLRVNTRLCAILGYTRVELSMRTLLDLTHEDDREGSASMTRELLDATRTSQAFEKRCIRSDGSAVWVLATLTLVRSGNGDPEYFIAIVEDIDARKRAEEELHALHQTLERRVAERTAELHDVNRELETFSYSVSHDLRAPLRGVSGFARALDEHAGKLLDKEARGYLDRIEASAKRMGDLIDDLLVLSRVGRGRVQWTEFDVSEMVTVVRVSTEDTRGRRARWDIQPGVRIVADPRLMRIALDNLIGNAWKFTREREETIIRFGVEERDDERVFFVADNGAGFDIAHAKNLFAPFQRLHPSRRFEGTGIGLATVQRIIHRHGGRIWAQAKPNEGASFFFTIGRTREDIE